MNISLFPNDDNVIILSHNHTSYNLMKYRPHHEVLFRKIHTFLIHNNIIKKDRNIIDLGAWIGDNSLPWSKMIDGIVYAIDPSKSNCDYIEKLKLLNKSDNIKVIQEAISNKKDMLSTNDDLTHCSFVYNNVENNGKTKISSTYLDKLYEDDIINNIGYIHLDVEGMEYLVLKGAKQIILNERPVVTYEIHLNLDKNIDTIQNMFTDNNYFVYMINEILPGNRTDCRNFLAIPIELLEEYIPNTNNISKKFIENMESDFNKYRYVLINHIGRCVYTFYNNKKDIEYAYNILNGGEFATIVFDILNDAILFEYGEKIIINECKKYYKSHISDNTNDLYKNILIFKK